MTSAPLPRETAKLSGLVLAILNQLEARLRDLADAGRNSTIDLHMLPLTAGDRKQLEAFLGHGEVTASLDILGASKITESAIAGVWWVTHANASGDVVVEQIEIALVPEILAATPAESRSAANTLAARLAELRSPCDRSSDAG